MRRLPVMSDSSPSPPTPTATQQLASNLLGRDVFEWIADRRGEHLPWRRVANELARATDGRIDVHEQTIRNWMLRQRVGAGAA